MSIEKTVTRYVRGENGRKHRVDLHYADNEHGFVQFAADSFPGQAVKVPGTYHYDRGGDLYRAAVDAWRQTFGA